MNRDTKTGGKTEDLMIIDYTGNRDGEIAYEVL